MAAGPHLINDSELANAVHRFLEEKNRAAHAAEIADAVLPIQNLPAKLANQLIQVILENDGRFRQTADERWELVSTKPLSVPLAECPFVCLDVEISGSARSPHIIELAAIQIDRMKVGAEFTTFVNPGRKIIPKIVSQLYSEKQTVIDSSVLESAPTFAEVAPKFLQFVGDRILVAHNAHFDLRMINRELKRLGDRKLVNPTLDTLQICRKFVPGVDSLKLSELAYYFGVPLEEHHLAIQDARALAQIFVKLLDRLEENGILTSDQLQPFFIQLKSRRKV